ncbi:MAG: MoxR family ATPase [Filifactor alocis]|nr:MoxR family ATPase [Filifactor alocis]
MIDFLKKQGVMQNLIDELERFRGYYKIDPKMEHRIVKPRFFYYGREVWEMAIAALLQGENLLLSGAKATGKNVLAENLAYAFGRPMWTVSLNIDSDSSSLIGSDTFVGGEVRFRKGSIYNCAEYGGFGIFDEINMAKNDALSVLHSALDYRRLIDVPGYEKERLHDATRFIATMNYGYAGTKELNEALVSRFMVLEIPKMTKEHLNYIIKTEYFDVKEEYADLFAELFLDLQLKAQYSEISSKAVDLRGLLGAIGVMRRGLPAGRALAMGIVGKTFDEFEKEIVEDVIRLRLTGKEVKEDVFHV